MVRLFWRPDCNILRVLLDIWRGGCAVGAALFVDVLAPAIKHDSSSAQTLKMLTR